MALDFADKHVVVTGGSGALGVAVLRELLEQGATCHVPVRDAAVPSNFAFANHERVRVVTGVELGDERSVEAFYAGLPAPPWASIHVAGGYAGGTVATTSAAVLRAQLEMNLVTCFLACREAVRAMGTRGGRIVNVTARAGLEPSGGATAYATSKAAVIHLTRALAAEVVQSGILVNAVAPSIMDTPANRASMPKADTSLWPQPAEVARTIAFLASPANALTHGAVVPVYGRA